MGLVDWNNDGVRDYEIARAGMIASSWMDESRGQGNGGPGDDGGCGIRACLVVLLAVVVLFFVLTALFNLLYAVSAG